MTSASHNQLPLLNSGCLQDHVEFIVNADFLEVKQLLGGAVGGLHTMLDEHFGISIVEYMAAGQQASFEAGFTSCVGCSGHT